MTFYLTVTVSYDSSPGELGQPNSPGARLILGVHFRVAGHAWGAVVDTPVQSF